MYKQNFVFVWCLKKEQPAWNPQTCTHTRTHTHTHTHTHVYTHRTHAHTLRAHADCEHAHCTHIHTHTNTHTHTHTKNNTLKIALQCPVVRLSNVRPCSLLAPTLCRTVQLPERQHANTTFRANPASLTRLVLTVQSFAIITKFCCCRREVLCCGSWQPSSSVVEEREMQCEHKGVLGILKKGWIHTGCLLHCVCVTSQSALHLNTSQRALGPCPQWAPRS